MNRQRGFSSLLMVLLLFALGSLLLQGLNQQQRSLLAQAANEMQALRDTASVQSALQWGKGLSWPRQEAVSCQQDVTLGWRACLRIFSDASVLLIGGSGTMLLWQTGTVEQNRVRFSPHGWSDFCPLKEASLCQMP
ncbi:DUF2509 family protein [Klebsiella indica]|uniref:DUF2509 family protein n=1 Tax=Klebsiella indica TaxID=2582917 RepID=A0A5R9LKG8_9ENTR|nr:MULTISPECIES: DUF2509 family protein [Klebsiella]TLV21388.1 DUF2509 family protein [Klebsiella indica]